MITQPRTYFPSIELIRFMAAFFIVIFHAFYGWKDNFGLPAALLGADGQLSSLGQMIEHGIHNLSLGVDVFFLISGFVITHILLAEKERTQKIDLGKYYLRRALRILPLFYIVIALTPLYNYYFKEATPDYLQYIFALGNFDLIRNGWGAATVNPLWTLCIEIQFYIVWALFIAYVPKKNLYKLFTFIILLSVAYRVWIFHQHNWWMNVYMHTLSRMDVIAIGSMIALWYHNNKNMSIKIPRAVRLMVYAIFLYVYVHDDIGYLDSIFLVSVKKFFYVSVISFAFVNYLFNPSAMFALSDKHPLQHLGKITYGLYMFNIVVVSLVIKAYHVYGMRNMFLYYVLITSAALLVATFSYFCLEKPFLSLKDRIKIPKRFVRETVE